MERMTNNIKKAAGLAVILVMSATMASAAGTSGAQFLKMGAGARAAALADAYSAVANDVTAAYWNPSGLAQLTQTELAVMHNSSLVDTQYQYLGVAKPFNKNVFALSLYRMDYGTIEGYDVSNNKTESFDASDLSISLSGSRKMNEKIFVGASAKYIAQSLENENATAMAADVGLFFKQAIFNRFNFAISAHNIGSDLKFVSQTEKLPLTYRAGIAGQITEKLLISADLAKPNDNGASVHFGGEFAASSIFTLRGGTKISPDNGVNLDGLTNVTAGLGIHVNRMSFDYSFAPFGELGTMHRVSFSYKFSNN